MTIKISTSLLLLSEEGRLISEYSLKIPEGVLHQIYKTCLSHGVVSQRDLIGQTIDLGCEQLDGLAEFFDQRLHVPLGCKLRLITYAVCDTPALLRPDIELRLAVFDKKGGHVGDIGLPSNIDLVELRKIICLPRDHNLLGDFPLGHEWQLSYFSDYISGLDPSGFDYEFSPCAREP